MLRELDPHQQSAVGGALDAEMRWAGEPAGDDVVRDGGKVIVNALAIELQSRLMPGGPKFAAAANVGEDERSAAFQPQFAQFGRVGRCLGGREAAVGVQNGGRAPVELLPGGMNDEVGDLGAILGYRLKLLDHGG